MVVRVLRCATAVLVVATLTAAPAAAIEPPTIPAEPVVPADPPAGPLEATEQDKPCNLPGVLPSPPVADIPTAAAMLDLGQAHKFATGRGVTVAVIDTGVAPNPRLPRLTGGGDYVSAGGDGLADCDMHGTLVAGIIGGQPSPEDPFVGVSPGVDLISYRQSSAHYRPTNPRGGANAMQAEAIGRIGALAAAVVKAANAGARVINMSVVSCVPVAHPIDQDALAVAVRYAAVEKDVVLVAAAGNTGSGEDCQNNPGHDPLVVDDPRNWSHVVSVSSPSWFDDYVISVGAVDPTGSPPDATNAAKFSMTGPWVSLAAPGVNTVSLGPDGKPINALPARDGLVNIFGTSFSAAYVSGTAALLRERFPNLTASQIRHRLTTTAHSGPRGIDNAIGYGLVDPVAALTYEMPDGPTGFNEIHRQELIAPPPVVPRDHRPQLAAAAIAAAAMIAAALVALTRARRTGGGQ